MQKPLHFLKSQVLPAKPWINLKIFLSVLSTLALILQAYSLASLVDHVYIQHQSFNVVTNLLLIIIVCIIVRSILACFKEKCGFYAANAVKIILRKRCFNHLLEQGSAVQQHYKPAELSAVLVDQIEATTEFYANYLPQMMIVGLIPILILIAIYPFNWVAGTLLFMTAPLIPLFMALIGWGAKSAHEKNFKALTRLGNQCLDLLKGMETLKIYNQTRQKARELEQSTTDFRKKTMEVLRIAFLSSAILEFFSAISIALLATYLGLSFLGHLNIGYYHHQPSLKVALFILLLAPEFYLPLRQLGSFYHAKQQAESVGENLIKFLSLKNKTEINMNSKVQPLFSKIQLENITFCYPENEYNSLDTLNLTIHRGEHIAILGESGSGKTTLINLFLGFIQPNSGKILIDDQNFENIDLDVWRAQLSWLGQDPQLFPGTLAENLRLADPRASDIQLLEACHLVQLGDFILSHPLGLDLLLGDRNGGLSGGQAQRLALARMFLKPAPIFILDEPSANLDEENAELLHQSLRAMIGNKTVIMTTHKKETLDLATRVILMSEGKIIADGPTNEIMKHPQLKHWQEQS